MGDPVLKRWTFPVDATHILMFARAIGDDNPVYRDAAAASTSEAGGIVAPPTFVMAAEQFDPDSTVRPKLDEPWFGSGREPGVPMSTPGLHASQEFTYQRPVRPGDVLTVEFRTGGSWEKEGKRSGKLKFVEYLYEYRDQQGELVISARRVRAYMEHVPQAS